MGIFDKLFGKDDKLSPESRKKLEDFKKEQGISNDSEWRDFKESVGVKTDSEFIEWVEDDSDDGKLFEWVTVPGHDICPDCKERHGMRKTYEEWSKIGLPGDDWSECSKTEEGCYCVLDVVEDE